MKGAFVKRNGQPRVMILVSGFGCPNVTFGQIIGRNHSFWFLFLKCLSGRREPGLNFYFNVQLALDSPVSPHIVLQRTQPGLTSGYGLGFGLAMIKPRDQNSGSSLLFPCLPVYCCVHGAALDLGSGITFSWPRYLNIGSALFKICEPGWCGGLNVIGLHKLTGVALSGHVALLEDIYHCWGRAGFEASCVQNTTQCYSRFPVACKT